VTILEKCKCQQGKIKHLNLVKIVHICGSLATGLFVNRLW
jgi:hypothetical protein